MPFESVSVQEHPDAMVVLKERGIVVPAVSVGDRYASGVDLREAADLLGVSYEPPVMLSPQELRDRYNELLALFDRFMEQMPPEGLVFKLPNRDREMSLVYIQIASVMRSFLAAYHDNAHDASFYYPPKDELLVTTADFRRRAVETVRLFNDWWEDDGCDDPLDRVVPAYWGHSTLHEVLEREVWHTAQHIRQAEYVLVELGISPAGRTDELLGGLPVPERVIE